VTEAAIDGADRAVIAGPARKYARAFKSLVEALRLRKRMPSQREDIRSSGH
jgi:hypothetical protein